MIKLTDRTQVNTGALLEALRDLAPMTHSTEADWTPEGQVECITSNGFDTMFIHIQHGQVIKVTAGDYTVSTYLPNGSEWNTYAVDEDENDFEDQVAEQIMLDIKEAFN